MAKDYEIKEVEELLGLKGLNEYEDFFEDKIKNRGKLIYDNDDIEDYKKEKNTYSCNITGTDKYSVSMIFKENKINKMNCTCPYYKDNKKGCKHLYALLIKIKYQENVHIIKENSLKMIENLKNQLYKSYKYVHDNIDNFDDKTLFLYNRTYEFYIEQIKVLNRLLDRFDTVNNNVDTFLRTKKTIEEFNTKYQDILSKEKITYEIRKPKKKKESSGLFGLVVGSILSGFIKGISSDNSSSSFYTEDELDAWNLDEYEKEAVLKDDYDPWDFMEEEKYEHYDDDGSYKD